MRRSEDDILIDMTRDVIADMPEPEPSVLYIDCAEYLEQTDHLSAEEQGAFIVLRMFMVQSGNRDILEDEEGLCRVLRCSRHRLSTKLPAKVQPRLDLLTGDLS